MENDILDSLGDIGYQGPLNDEVVFAKALDGGHKSLEFTKLVHILADELKTLCNLEETVNLISSSDESSSFLLELSCFLKELKCPYKCLISGHMSSRLQSKEDRLLLLDYLISELMAARMVQVDHPKEKQGSGMEIVMQESPTAKDLKEILIALKFNKPPPNITPEMLFAKLESKLKDTIAKEGDKLVGKPLYNKALTDKDWKVLEESYTDMYEEYSLRRETLLTRLECTIQSFEWSDRLKSKKDVIQSVYRPKRDALKMKPNVKLSDFLAARSSLLLVEKTSSANVRKNTQSEVTKVIMGQVPDRGGRPNEAQPPPPEMPSWLQRSTGQQGRGGGRGGRGGGERGHKQAQRRTKTVRTTKPTRSRRVVTKTTEPIGAAVRAVLTIVGAVMTPIGAVMTTIGAASTIEAVMTTSGAVMKTAGVTTTVVDTRVMIARAVIIKVAVAATNKATVLTRVDTNAAATRTSMTTEPGGITRTGAEGATGADVDIS